MSGVLSLDSGPRVRLCPSKHQSGWSSRAAEPGRAGLGDGEQAVEANCVPETEFRLTVPHEMYDVRDRPEVVALLSDILM